MKIRLLLKSEPIGEIEWSFTDRRSKVGELVSIITPEYPEISQGLLSMLTDPNARPEMVYCHGHRYDDVSPYLEGVVQVLELTKAMVPGFDHDFDGDLSMRVPPGATD